MKKYNIGLDIGTNSVGWAVVESEKQKVLRKGNKKLWGVRLFEEAVSASSRRNFRSTRRRYDRRRYRIKLLKEEFQNEINKVDPIFYQIMKESFYNKNDKVNKTIELNKEEKDFFNFYQKNYPTIYHLRNDLINEDKKFDIRLVYLAIHHIIKYRGSFLVQGEFNTESLNIEESFHNVVSLINIYCEEFNVDENIDYTDLEKILLLDSKNDKKVELTSYFNFMPKEFTNEFIKMINGNKFNFIKMFLLDIDSAKVELSFSTTEYDDKYDEYEKLLGERIELLETLKNLYDIVYLKKIFKESKTPSLSNLMIRYYDKHKEDLKFLKQVFNVDRTIGGKNENLYDKLFRTKNNAKKENYCLYDRYITNSITYDDFQKELKKLFDSVNWNNVNSFLVKKYNEEILMRLENGDFLPRLTSVENGKFPYQLNKNELVKIIENQKKYYPFLGDEYNGTNKLVQLLEFRIPYYVGPLTTTEKSNFAWMIRKSGQESIRITPYNFDEVVDKEASAEEFIKKMISSCTYLLNEKAIPANSILYSKFKVLNELKQIKINDNPLSKELQEQIYNDLFLNTSGTITDKKFKEYLYANKVTDIYGDDILVKGYSADEKFANSMKSYVDFFGIDGVFENTNYTLNDAEKIIEWITIFEDKNILKVKLNREYPDLNEEKVNKLLKTKYTGWSSLSRKLLTGVLYFDKETNTSKSIMDLMIETKENFMQILNNKKYKFLELIDKINGEQITKKVNYDLVRDLVTSPATKRGIYQALKIVDEITNYIGYDPEYISIEMARNEDKKERKPDRKKYLESLYKEYKNKIDNYNDLNKELKNQEKIDSEKLFLYFIQEGKSLYSMTPLKIENLSDYEVDHIIPRTLIKDDSIDNKALVLKEENQNKAASFVLPSNYKTDTNRKWWSRLKSIGLISNKKYYNLIRKEFNSKDIEGFINRQIVETRQITKHVANILANLYENSKVIYLKANLSHNYREKFELYKFRDINDYHHAHDAYLAAVLGEYKEKYLRKNIDFDMVKELNKDLIANKDYKSLKYGYVINSLDDKMNYLINDIIPMQIDEETGEVITKEFDSKVFNKNIENALYSNDILISKKVEYKSGEFYNQTKQRKGSKGVSLKENLPTKLYGSYTSLNPAYAVMVTYLNKGKETKKIIGMPIYILTTSKKDEMKTTDYLVNLLKLKDNKDILKISSPIPFYSLIEWECGQFYLVGATERGAEIINAKQFKFEKQFLTTHKETLNKLFNNKKSSVDENVYLRQLDEIIVYLIDKIEREYICFKTLNDRLKDWVKLLDNNLENKEQFIIEILKTLKCSSIHGNFKFINQTSEFGRKKDKSISSCKIYNNSYTGIWSKYNEF